MKFKKKTPSFTVFKGAPNALTIRDNIELASYTVICGGAFAEQFMDAVRKKSVRVI